MHKKTAQHTSEIARRSIRPRRHIWRCSPPRRLAGPRRPLRRHRQATGQRRSTASRSASRPPTIIYLSHPAAKELSLGCRGENFSIELYAKGDRKPKPEFFNLVGAAAAIIFTCRRTTRTTGTTRCIKRMGILRGDKVSMRYRRLNMECTRTKTEASIAVTRGKDE